MGIFVPGGWLVQEVTKGAVFLPADGPTRTHDPSDRPSPPRSRPPPVLADFASSFHDPQQSDALANIEQWAIDLA
jgi:hypothetical protein